MKQINFYASVISLCTMLGACKKESGQSSAPLPSAHEYVKSVKGTSTGTAVTATIGKNGGSFHSADGILSITVPAGAVEGNTMFSVEPITNALNGRFQAYRLQPEDVHFQLPLTITYSYEGADLTGTDPSLLFLAFQDKDGYYHFPKDLESFPSQKKLSVQSRHFSDWMIIAEFELIVEGRDHSKGYVELREKEHANFYLKGYTPENPNPADTGIDVAPLIYIANVSSTVWELTQHIGTLLSGDTVARTLYTAPAVIDHPQVTNAVVTIRGELGYDNNGKNVGLQSFLLPIHLSSDSYFQLTVDGVKEDIPCAKTGATRVPGGMAVSAQMSDGGTISFTIMSSAAGGFPFGLPGEPGTASISYVDVQANKSYIAFHAADCVNGGARPIFSSGGVTLTDYGHDDTEYTAGSFSGTLYFSNWCDAKAQKAVSATFRIKMQE